MDFIGDEFSGLSSNSNGGTNKEHEQSLINMGFLPEKEKKEMPANMRYLFDTYKEIKFSVTNDNKLAPRDELSYSSLNEYQRATGFILSGTECSIMLSIDAIFNQQR